jgi:hypothetical protein
MKKHWMKNIGAGRMGLGVCLGAWLFVPSVLGQTFSRTYTVGELIGDVQDPARVFEVVVNGSGIDRLTEVKVGLKLVGATAGGGFASEMVVMLTKDLTTTSVLLNQVGVGVGSWASSVIGYGYDGWDVTFADGATRGDVHGYDAGSGILTGEVAPDGRVLPGDVSRPWTLSAMNGLTGDGHWYLSVADLGVGGVMRLESWSLTMKGLAAVPEPGMWGCVVGLGLGVWGWVRRSR